jgi:SAM-dependent methyltransferase
MEMGNDRRLCEQMSERDFYTPMVLKLYDFYVHRMNNHFFWKCPTCTLIAHYNKHITANHLEIGLGTGFLLDQCDMPSPSNRLVFSDVSTHCLEKASRRLLRYAPVSVQRSVLEPMTGIGESFESVGFNYVLHCLPGNLASKGRLAFQHIADVLQPGGVVFGSTILAKEVPVSLQARLQMWALNRRGFFCNSQDGLSALSTVLDNAFAEHEVETYGCVALFYARKEK